MGFLDNLRGKAQKAVDDHGDKIAKGIDQAAAAADKRTKGKYSKHIGTGTARAKDALERLDSKRDGDNGPGTPGGTADGPGPTPGTPTR